MYKSILMDNLEALELFSSDKYYIVPVKKVPQKEKRKRGEHKSNNLVTLGHHRKRDISLNIVKRPWFAREIINCRGEEKDRITLHDNKNKK